MSCHHCFFLPNHYMLSFSHFQEDKRWISYIGDSPKPPPNRITMTLPVLNNAKYCVFFVTGASKAQIIKVL